MFHTSETRGFVMIYFCLAPAENRRFTFSLPNTFLSVDDLWKYHLLNEHFIAWKMSTKINGTRNECECPNHAFLVARLISWTLIMINCSWFMCLSFEVSTKDSTTCLIMPINCGKSLNSFENVRCQKIWNPWKFSAAFPQTTWRCH